VEYLHSTEAKPSLPPSIKATIYHSSPISSILHSKKGKVYNNVSAKTTTETICVIIPVEEK
jgi:hypothetical protein